MQKSSSCFPPHQKYEVLVYKSCLIYVFKLLDNFNSSLTLELKKNYLKNLHTLKKMYELSVGLVSQLSNNITYALWNEH
jgi:hypothetical protein